MSSSGQTSRDIFDFFGLPPELRDAIYDLDNTVDYCDLPSATGLDQVVNLRTRVPLTNLLLVNRQFSHEYTARCQALKTVTVRDTAKDAYEDITAHAKARDAAQLELRLLIRSWSDEDHDPGHVAVPTDVVGADVDLHLDWIPVLAAQMHSLRSIHISLHMQRSKALEKCYNLLLECLPRFAAIAKVDLLEIRLCQGLGDRSGTDGPSVHLASWTRCNDVTSTCAENLKYYDRRPDSNPTSRSDDELGQRTLGSDGEGTDDEVVAG